ncbi:hypothetical protein, partial [Bradyrhizobium ottawaense]|uniref:hypothetical protein n=1 Tax=Bradyrhizobium ottawaense TaxID=931866 RepID=UPI0030C6AC5D
PLQQTEDDVVGRHEALDKSRTRQDQPPVAPACGPRRRGARLIAASVLPVGPRLTRRFVKCLAECTGPLLAQDIVGVAAA